jgi:anti-sigma-K factor RskA
MDTEEIHDLTAAYALHALDSDDELEYEEHLRHCERCRQELAELRDVTAALALAAEGPAPPASLRGRIIDAALAERPNVVPLRRRWVVPAIGSAAAVAACAAIGLGVWATSLRGSLDERTAAAEAQAEVLALIAGPGLVQIPISGDAQGTLVFNRDGDAALVFAGLPAAPEGKTYQVWVIEGAAPVPAGLFDGGNGASVVRVTEQVPIGATVAVTVEPDGGVDAPTTDPFAIATVATRV